MSLYTKRYFILLKKGIFLFGITFALIYSCVYPVDIKMRPQENRVPYFVNDAIYPTSGIITIDKSCKSITFTIGKVADEDTDDYLYMRWFVNYDLDPSIAQEAVIEPNGNLEREGDSFELMLDSYLLDPSVSGRVTNLIEVVLTDRPFEDSSVEPKNRAIKDGAGVTVFRWALELTDENVCNQ